MLWNAGERCSVKVERMRTRKTAVVVCPSAGLADCLSMVLQTCMTEVCGLLVTTVRLSGPGSVPPELHSFLCWGWIGRRRRVSSPWRPDNCVTPSMYGVRPSNRTAHLHAMSLWQTAGNLVSIVLLGKPESPLCHCRSCCDDVDEQDVSLQLSDWSYLKQSTTNV